MKAELEASDLLPILEPIKGLLEGMIESAFKKGQLPSDRILTVEELAKVLKIKVSHVYALVNDAKYNENGIPFMKVGGMLRFQEREVIEWAKENRHSGQSELRILIDGARGGETNTVKAPRKNQSRRIQQ
jgi:excisionase family DNA binding protein